MDETSPFDNPEERKAKVIFRVRSGALSAKEGATLLGLSRKSYFEWEARGLKGMLSALTEKQPGRPRKEEDPEKEAMKKRIAELEEELLVAKKTLQVRKLLEAWGKLKAKETVKKTSAGKKS